VHRWSKGEKTSNRGGRAKLEGGKCSERQKKPRGSRTNEGMKGGALYKSKDPGGKRKQAIKEGVMFIKSG